MPFKLKGGRISRPERAFGLALAVAITCLGILCIAQPADAFSLNQTELDKLKRGEPVLRIRAGQDGASAIVDAAIEIRARPHLVWSAMTDCDRATTYLDSLKSCRIIQTAKDGSWDVREHRVKPALLLPETRSVFRSDYLKPKEIRFKRVAGDLRSLMGKWNLLPISRGRATVLVYHAEISIDIPLPNFMIHNAIENDLTTALISLKREVVRSAR